MASAEFQEKGLPAPADPGAATGTVYTDEQQLILDYVLDMFMPRLDFDAILTALVDYRWDVIDTVEYLSEIVKALEERKMLHEYKMMQEKSKSNARVQTSRIGYVKEVPKHKRGNRKPVQKTKMASGKEMTKDKSGSNVPTTTKSQQSQTACGTEMTKCVPAEISEISNSDTEDIVVIEESDDSDNFTADTIPVAPQVCTEIVAKPRSFADVCSTEHVIPPVLNIAHGLLPTKVSYEQLKRTRDSIERVKLFVKEGIKVMVILRGCPGSGKSYLARELVNLCCPGMNYYYYVYSADDYFRLLSAEGRGGYNPDLVSDAHQWTQRNIRLALNNNLTPIIVDNTHTRAWEMQIYVAMAVRNGYDIEIIEPNTPWMFSCKELAKRNTHNVPKTKIKIMLDRYEHDITPLYLLNIFNLRYDSDNYPPQYGSTRPNNKEILEHANYMNAVSTGKCAKPQAKQKNEKQGAKIRPHSEDMKTIGNMFAPGSTHPAALCFKALKSAVTYNPNDDSELQITEDNENEEMEEDENDEEEEKGEEIEKEVKEDEKKQEEDHLQKEKLNAVDSFVKDDRHEDLDIEGDTNCTSEDSQSKEQSADLISFCDEEKISDLIVLEVEDDIVQNETTEDHAPVHQEESSPNMELIGLEVSSIEKTGAVSPNTNTADPEVHNSSSSVLGLYNSEDNDLTSDHRDSKTDIASLQVHNNIACLKSDYESSDHIPVERTIACLVEGMCGKNTEVTESSTNVNVVTPTKDTKGCTTNMLDVTKYRERNTNVSHVNNRSNKCNINSFMNAQHSMQNDESLCRNEREVNVNRFVNNDLSSSSTGLKNINRSEDGAVESLTRMIESNLNSLFCLMKRNPNSVSSNQNICSDDTCSNSEMSVSMDRSRCVGNKPDTMSSLETVTENLRSCISSRRGSNSTEHLPASIETSTSRFIGNDLHNLIFESSKCTSNKNTNCINESVSTLMEEKTNMAVNNECATLPLAILTGANNNSNEFKPFGNISEVALSSVDSNISRLINSDSGQNNKFHEFNLCDSSKLSSMPQIANINRFVNNDLAVLSSDSNKNSNEFSISCSRPLTSAEPNSICSNPLTSIETDSKRVENNDLAMSSSGTMFGLNNSIIGTDSCCSIKSTLAAMEGVNRFVNNDLALSSNILTGQNKKFNNSCWSYTSELTSSDISKLTNNDVAVPFGGTSFGLNNDFSGLNNTCGPTLPVDGGVNRFVNNDFAVLPLNKKSNEFSAWGDDSVVTQKSEQNINIFLNNDLNSSVFVTLDGGSSTSRKSTNCIAELSSTAVEVDTGKFLSSLNAISPSYKCSNVNISSNCFLSSEAVGPSLQGRSLSPSMNNFANTQTFSVKPEHNNNMGMKNRDLESEEVTRVLSPNSIEINKHSTESDKNENLGITSQFNESGGILANDFVAPTDHLLNSNVLVNSTENLAYKTCTSIILPAISNEMNCENVGECSSGTPISTTNQCEQEGKMLLKEKNYQKEDETSEICDPSSDTMKGIKKQILEKTSKFDTQSTRDEELWKEWEDDENRDRGGEVRSVPEGSQEPKYCETPSPTECSTVVFDTTHTMKKSQNTPEDTDKKSATALKPEDLEVSDILQINESCLRNNLEEITKFNLPSAMKSEPTAIKEFNQDVATDVNIVEGLWEVKHPEHPETAIVHFSPCFSSTAVPSGLEDGCSKSSRMFGEHTSNDDKHLSATDSFNVDTSNKHLTRSTQVCSPIEQWKPKPSRKDEKLRKKGDKPKNDKNMRVNEWGVLENNEVNWSLNDEKSAIPDLQTICSQLKEELLQGGVHDKATSTSYEEIRLGENTSGSYILTGHCREINEFTCLDLSKCSPVKKRVYNKSTMTEDDELFIKAKPTIEQLTSVFTTEEAYMLSDLFEHCKGDINWILELLCDHGFPPLADQLNMFMSLQGRELSTSNTEGTTKQEITVENKKNRRKRNRRKTETGENGETKVSKKKETNNDESKVFDSSDLNLNEEPQEEMVQFLLDPGFVDQLTHKFGNPTLIDLKEFQPVVKLPISLAKQLHAHLIESVIMQFEEHEAILGEYAEEDEEAAKQLLQSRENSEEPEILDIIAMEKSLHDVKQEYNGDVHTEDTDTFRLSLQLLTHSFPSMSSEIIVDIFYNLGCNYEATLNVLREQAKEVPNNVNSQQVEMQQTYLLKQIKEQRSKNDGVSRSKDTFSSRLSFKLLTEAFPQMNPDTISQVFEMNNYNYYETLTSLREHHSDKCAYTENQSNTDCNGEADQGSIFTTEKTREDAITNMENLRSSAELAHQHSQVYAQKMQEAIREKKYAVASYYRELMHAYKERHEKFNAKAAAELIGTSLHGNNVIDLHYFKVKEALHVLDIFIDRHINKLSNGNQGNKTKLFIITGRGKRSFEGTSQLKPPIIKRLIRRKLEVTEKVGMLTVIVRRNSLMTKDL